ncbi:hypothetical protein EJ110_NYTH43034, partial [Nymphaea thermarum]
AHSRTERGEGEGEGFLNGFPYLWPLSPPLPRSIRSLLAVRPSSLLKRALAISRGYHIDQITLLSEFLSLVPFLRRDRSSERRESMSDVKDFDTNKQESTNIDVDKKENDCASTEINEEEMIKKKYGGILPKKPPLISKPTPQEVRSRRSVYAPTDGEGGNSSDNPKGNY